MQSHGWLYNDKDNSYCCLGVKLEITGQHGRLFGSTMSQAKYMGLTRDSAKFFAGLNDGTAEHCPLSFRQIALVIENVPEAEWS